MSVPAPVVPLAALQVQQVALWVQQVALWVRSQWQVSLRSEEL